MVFFILAKTYKNLGFKLFATFCFTIVLKGLVLCAMFFEIIIIFVIICYYFLWTVAQLISREQHI